MRILVDTNILMSALLWPGSKPAKALFYVNDHHTVVLCDKNIAELRSVLERKAPGALSDMDAFLASFAYELIPSSEHAEKLIRDVKDQPILNAAICSGVDIILTGDKDFLSLDIGTPRCLSVSRFLTEFEIK